ncbi:MAG: pyruvate:ferredoxin (flavodoxin) oxidoreductase [Planctomycetes bacterium]|nr:pyruvate:ferredoxin (flavodoxin) oxidoreductase [Planctomycetota bacterium]
MTDRQQVIIDGNEAAAAIAHKLNEVIAIYPITPSSPMGELADFWSAQGEPNLWGTVPVVLEMQSEAGAAGAVHGALQTGALTTTFTSSQGLLLMIPNMYKIAGELSPTVFHIAARTVATSALSIFGDHSDVMAARATGFALIASNSVQEVMDLALIAQAASLRSRIPILHFFDGFRTSHEVMKIEELADEDLQALIDDRLVHQHRARALSPDHPVLRGSAMNPDVAFQAREACNPFYLKFPEILLEEMRRFARRIGRSYQLFEYEGAPDAERLMVIMGSGAETAAETAACLNRRGEKVGLVKVRLFRPFSVPHFLKALPGSVKSIAVLDRTKEPGAIGEPLYQDVLTALAEGAASGLSPLPGMPRVIGGRYGLSSKEFTPGMVKAVYDELKKDRPKNHFTVGISDDLTGTSLEYDAGFDTQDAEVFQAVFFGLGADGTVSANKNSIKIIGEKTENHAQGYFVYDSKKAGSITISHLRFGPRPIRSTYLIQKADFVACHQFHFLERYDILDCAAEGATFLLNSPYGPEAVWDRIPRKVQEEVIRKKLKFFVVDAYRIAKENDLGTRINTIMQTCFFKIAEIISPEVAVSEIKRVIESSYGRKGAEIVERNFRAVDQALETLHAVKVPARAAGTIELPPVVPPESPPYVKDITSWMIAGKGDLLSVSKLPCDGTFPTGTAHWERRNLALEIPAWEPEVCIQCGKCTFVCPHTAIRVKVYEEKHLAGHPATFKWTDVHGKEFSDLLYTIQVTPEDCTGCGLCVHVCPAKNKKETRLKAINMTPQPPLREGEARNYDFFLKLPEVDRRQVKLETLRGSQLLEPLFEASGACAGCGETPYLKLLSQLYGDRLLVANATGCSSIYGGNLPTTPWTTNRDGRGPAWSNSLFEDNAEFGLGFRLTLDQQGELARQLVKRLSPRIGEELARAILEAPQSDEADIHEQRLRIAQLRQRLEGIDGPEARNLLSVAGALVRKSVWIVGGDGWAYDIGFGGLDHVLASGKKVNILVLDTEVYSNTGGQMSKATPRAAVAKFASAGKPTGKKDMALMAMSYGNVYIAKVAFGANEAQTIQAFIEAERHPGPALIIAYSHCIAHGINMGTATDNQKAAVQSGFWPLFRYNPEWALEGKNPFKLDSQAPKLPFKEFAYKEMRFNMLSKSYPKEAQALMAKAEEDIKSRWRLYSQLASLSCGAKEKENAEG